MQERNLKVVLSLDDQATAGINNAKQKVNELGESFKKAVGPSTAFTAAVVSSMGLAVNSAIKFEDTFAGVRKTVEASENEFQQLIKNIRNIAIETPLATDKLNQIGELAGQLGISGVDNLTKFINVIARMAVTTDLTEEVASMAFARIINIMGISQTEVDRMGSSVVDLGNNFATTESQIVDFALRIAGAGKVAGLTTADILGIATALSSIGVQSELGGTAVQQALISMKLAVEQGGSDLRHFSLLAGMTAKEFAVLFEKDATAAFVAFVEGIKERGSNAVFNLDQLGLAGVRSLKAFLGLSEAEDLLAESIKTSSEAWEENTALTIEAEKRFETTASQIDIAKNRLNELGISIGEKVLPSVNNMLDGFGGLLDKAPGIIKFFDEHSDLAIVLGGAIAGTMVPAVAALAIKFGALALTLAPFTIGGALLGGVFLLLDKISKNVTGTGLIDQIVAAFELLKMKVSDAVGFLQWLIDTAGNVVTALDFIGTVTGVFSKVESGFQRMSNAFQGFKDNFGSFVDKITASPLGQAVSFLGFQHGGTVPGSTTQAVPAILHGGERVLSKHAVENNSYSSSPTINFYGGVSVRSDQDIDTLARRISDILDRQSELARLGAL